MKTGLLIICFFALLLSGQDAPTRISGPQPPVPPLPLRPVPTPTNSSRIFTNANGDVVVQTITVIRKADPKRHYYGVMMGEIAYLGEMTSVEYEKWAFTGSQALANQPEIVRWRFIFATTNKIAVPDLVHVQ